MCFWRCHNRELGYLFQMRKRLKQGSAEKNKNTWFSVRENWAPSRSNHALPGAMYAQFEVVLHEINLWLEVEWLVRMPTIDKMTKSALCQEKSVFRNRFTIDNSGLEKWNNMVKISWYLSAPSIPGLTCITSMTHPPKSCKTARSIIYNDNPGAMNHP